MSAKHFTLAALGLALLLAVIAWHGVTPEAGTGHVRTARSAPDVTQASSLGMVSATPATPAAPAAPARPWKETLKKFNAARSYRAFIYDAEKNQTAGATQYTLQVIGICVNALLIMDEASLKRPQQRAALTELRGRCDMSPDELESEFSVMSSKMANPDPATKQLMVAAAEFALATPAAEQRAVDAILATQDPSVMQELAVAPNWQAGNTRHFMGREHEFGPGSNFQFAFGLAQCELGLDCGAGSPATLILCVRNNWCAASYRDALRQGLDAGQPNRYQQISLLAAQLATQIRAQNSAAFISKK